MAIKGKNKSGVPSGYCSGLQGDEKIIRQNLQAAHSSLPGEPQPKLSAPAPAAPAMRAAPAGPGGKAGLAPPNIFTTMEKGPKAPRETAGE